MGTVRANGNAGDLCWTPAPTRTSTSSSSASEGEADSGEVKTDNEEDFDSQMDEDGIIGLKEALEEAELWESHTEEDGEDGEDEEDEQLWSRMAVPEDPSCDVTDRRDSGSPSHTDTSEKEKHPLSPYRGAAGSFEVWTEDEEPRRRSIKKGRKYPTKRESTPRLPPSDRQPVAAEEVADGDAEGDGVGQKNGSGVGNADISAEGGVMGGDAGETCSSRRPADAAQNGHSKGSSTPGTPDSDPCGSGSASPSSPPDLRPASRSPSPPRAYVYPHLLHFTSDELANTPGIIDETFPETCFTESLTESYSSRVSQAPKLPWPYLAGKEEFKPSALAAASPAGAQPKSPRDSRHRPAAAPRKARQHSQKPSSSSRTSFLRRPQAAVPDSAFESPHPDRRRMVPRAGFSKIRVRNINLELDEARRGTLSYRTPNFSKVEARVHFPKSEYKPPKSRNSTKTLPPAEAHVGFKSPADIVREVLLTGADGPPATPGSAGPEVGAASPAVPEEFRCPQQATKLVEQLQEDYNRLLTKYAEAENTIDRLRLEAKVNLTSDPARPSHSVQAKMNPDGSKVMTLNFPQALRAQISSASPHPNRPGEDQRVSPAPSLVSNSSRRSEGHNPTRTLSKQASKFLQQVQTFEHLIKSGKLHPFEQLKGLSQMVQGLDCLERGYLEARDEHRLRQQRVAEIGPFDPNRELEGLIFQCGTCMEELREQVEQCKDQMDQDQMEQVDQAQVYKAQVHQSQDQQQVQQLKLHQGHGLVDQGQMDQGQVDQGQVDQGQVDQRQVHQWQVHQRQVHHRHVHQEQVQVHQGQDQWQGQVDQRQVHQRQVHQRHVHQGHVHQGKVQVNQGQDQVYQRQEQRQDQGRDQGHVHQGQVQVNQGQDQVHQRQEQRQEQRQDQGRDQGQMDQDPGKFISRAPPSPPSHPTPSSMTSSLPQPESLVLPLSGESGGRLVGEVSSASEDSEVEESMMEDEMALYLASLQLRLEEQDLVLLADKPSEPASITSMSSFQSFRQLPRFLDRGLDGGGTHHHHHHHHHQPGGVGVQTRLPHRRRSKPGHQDALVPNGLQRSRESNPPAGNSGRVRSPASPCSAHGPPPPPPTPPPAARTRSRSRLVEVDGRSHSSSLTSLGDSAASETRSSRLQPKPRGALSQDGIISPETDSGFVGSESWRLMLGAVPSPVHQREPGRGSLHQAASPSGQPVPHPSRPSSPSGPASPSGPSGPSSPSSPSGPSPLHHGATSRPGLPRPTRREWHPMRPWSRERRAGSASPPCWTRPGSPSSDSGKDSDHTYSGSPDNEQRRSGRPARTSSSPAASHHHDDPRHAPTSGQATNRNEAIQNLQAEVNRLKERLESSLRTARPLGPARVSTSNQGSDAHLDTQPIRTARPPGPARVSTSNQGSDAHLDTQPIRSAQPPGPAWFSTSNQGSDMHLNTQPIRSAQPSGPTWVSDSNQGSDMHLDTQPIRPARLPGPAQVSDSNQGGDTHLSTQPIRSGRRTWDTAPEQRGEQWRDHGELQEQSKPASRKRSASTPSQGAEQHTSTCYSEPGRSTPPSQLSRHVSPAGVEGNCSRSDSAWSRTPPSRQQCSAGSPVPAGQPDGSGDGARLCPRCSSRLRPHPAGTGRRDPDGSSQCRCCPTCGRSKSSGDGAQPAPTGEKEPGLVHRDTQTTQAPGGETRGEAFVAAPKSTVLSGVPLCVCPLFCSTPVVKVEGRPQRLWLPADQAAVRRSSPKVRARGETRGRAGGSLSADRQHALSSSLNKALQAARVMKNTSRHMARSLAAGLHHQDALSRSCIY